MPADLFSLLKSNAYPGRGIVLGRTDKYAVLAYFIMGRSENSRNRIFTPFEDSIRTEAYDSAKLADPSLIIYAPVRMLGNETIVTNGDQTDTIVEYLENGGTFEQALQTRTFEPDAPNYTPRISGMMTVADGACNYRLSILKSNSGNPDSVQRFFFEYPSPCLGQGHLIHTYCCDGNPIPSFMGEPVCVSIPSEIDVFSDSLWESLNDDNKVSLFVRYIPISGGEEQTRIINKNNR